MWFLYLFVFIVFYGTLLILPLYVLLSVMRGRVRVHQTPVTGGHYGVRYSKGTGGRVLRVSVGSRVLTFNRLQEA